MIAGAITTTIAATSTPPGRGGIGVIRISGPLSASIASSITGLTAFTPRHAYYTPFKRQNGSIIDAGIVLFFPGPASYTGEDIVELHTHGNPLVLDQLLQSLYQAGAIPAKPGEFTERAYLNGKLDLTQAEAVADLINSQTAEAAQAAQNSLEGKFSQLINGLLEQIIHLRLNIEAAIDFTDDDIDFVAESWIGDKLNAVLKQITLITRSAQQGALLHEGMTLALIGRPNAGKSSIMNQLSGQETSIVSEEPGTTRDIVREKITLNGVPVQVLDTAGLRESSDLVEQEGIKRARAALQKVDHALLITTLETRDEDEKLLEISPVGTTIWRVINKIDLHPSRTQGIVTEEKKVYIYLSAKTGEGIDLLAKCLLGHSPSTPHEGVFSARRRHLVALASMEDHIANACLNWKNRQGELIAEDLRLAQQELDKITGTYTNDELLGEIFASLCIGK